MTGSKVICSPQWWIGIGGLNSKVKVGPLLLLLIAALTAIAAAAAAAAAPSGVQAMRLVSMASFCP